MNELEAKTYLTKLRQRHNLWRLLEVLLLFCSGLFLTLLFIHFTSLNEFATLIIAAEIVFMIFAFSLFQQKIFKTTDAKIVRFLNWRYPELESSADLIIADDQNLTRLQSIQKTRSISNLTLIKNEINLPHSIMRYSVVFAVASLALISAKIWFNQLPYRNNTENKLIKSIPSGLASKIAVTGIDKLMITITPPSYTKLKSFMAGTSDINIPEGSLVQWFVKFTNTVKNPTLILSGKDSIQLKKTHDGFSIGLVIGSSGFYQITWDANQKINETDFYKIEMTHDEAPIIKIDAPTQFTELTYTKNISVQIKTSLSDDYELSDGWITATVAKGSGESVKFREEKIKFETPENIQGRKVLAMATINLDRMRLDPGDELYFYVEAFDNKTPLKQSSRSETYFISIKDTASAVSSLEGGMGVDQLPEYFRSQRQIIIDSEKLLEEKKSNKVSMENFNKRSNSLAFDQKILRLRYGQFLGEEHEDGVPETHEDKAEFKAEDVTKIYGHVHDTPNENNQVAFSEQSIKAKLKAAISTMWDAELQLRLNRPDVSLPYQYKILKLLKDVSNDSRIYVRRTGFDPPPIKEDKRLKGELTEIHPGIVTSVIAEENKFVYIRKAIGLIEKSIDKDSIKFSPSEQNILLHAGREMATVAIERPGEYLHALSTLKSLAGNAIPQNDFHKSLIGIRSAFWRLLPEQNDSPSQQSQAIHPVSRIFIEKLKSAND